tara:strand:+ start:119 stop:478 length:360 start_codon:yes stop_codon:yes gene_type:complete
MKLSKDKLKQIIKEEVDQILSENAEVVDLGQYKEERALNQIAEVMDDIEDMLAGVSSNLLTIVRSVGQSPHAELYKTMQPGKLEALELIWEMIADWSFDMYPKDPEGIARKKNCLRDEE